MQLLANVLWCTLFLFFLSPTHAWPMKDDILGIRSVSSLAYQRKPSSRTYGSPAYHEDLRSAASSGKTPVSRRWMSDPLGNNWEVVHEHISIFLPPATVAQILTELYISLMETTVSTWMYTDATSHFIVKKGLLELEFWSPTGVIPWVFVHSLGEVLLRTARLGYAGRFNAVFLNEATGSQIVVAMRVNMVARAA